MSALMKRAKTVMRIGKRIWVDLIRIKIRKDDGVKREES
jgi:hypothetical protein